MNISKSSPIGVFDSGIGGLSVLKQFIRFLPGESYIYLGDTARVPYGNKSQKIVAAYAKESTEFLISKGVKIIITACNTVSAVALNSVRDAAGGIPVIGMIEPAAAAALRATRNGRIGIIGTRATIGSNSYLNEINKISGSAEIEVISQACPMFVPIVEEGLLRHPASNLIAEDFLGDLKNAGVDTLVLGCTHYPLLSHLISDFMPAGIVLIDSGEHASVSALRLLAESNLLIEPTRDFVNKPDIKFYVTDLPANFFELAKNFLGFDIDMPEVINLGQAI